MPAPAAWKLVVPVAALAAIGLIMMSPGGPTVRQPPSAGANRLATLGYLAAQDLPDAVALLPRPPRADSAAMKRDAQARDDALRLRGTARYVLASADANREQANTAAAFQCAFGTEISEAHTPALYRLLGKVRLDVRAATYPAKYHFKRNRPFVMHDAHTCYPADEQNVRNDGSYPSARGAVGFALAEVLAGLNPARAGEIRQRAEEFGRSRVVCDEEWLSDVEAGRVIAAATLRKIEQEPAFRADLDSARKEAAARLKSSVTPPNCPSEALALASR